MSAEGVTMQKRYRQKCIFDENSDQECPICMEMRGQNVFISCERCRQKCCLACFDTIMGKNCEEGKLISCPFCREHIGEVARPFRNYLPQVRDNKTRCAACQLFIASSIERPTICNHGVVCDHCYQSHNKRPFCNFCYHKYNAILAAMILLIGLIFVIGRRVN